MGDKTSIEWTDATWNPVRGCAIVSKGCTNCYAMRQAHRSSGAGGAYEGLTQLSRGGPVWTGRIRTVPELLDQPLRWRRPRRIFVNSMSDLFHHEVPETFIDQVFAVMAAAHHHVYQVLTKRPERMRAYLSAQPMARRRWEDINVRAGRGRLPAGTVLPNVWLGVSVEDQAAADERIPLLLQTPASVRWISAEPLLGPLDITRWIGEGRCAGAEDGVHCVHWWDDDGHPCCRCKQIGTINWVVAGGESGSGARPMHPAWARALRDQCEADGVRFFFKQWGNWLPPGQDGDPEHVPHIINAGDHPLHTTKKAAGRQLDGRTHDEYPA